MAKFKCDFSAVELPEGRHGSTGVNMNAYDSFFSGLQSDELLSVLRPAAEALRDYYKATILRLFKRRTGSLADSIQVVEYSNDRSYMDLSEASIFVGPKGKHKSGKRARKSRAGPADRKYAKHNREVSALDLKNEELAYLLEFGTPRITATHWMENTNEEVSEEIQDMIEAEFDNLLRKKGLIE